MVLRQMKVRGVKSARLFVGDGNLGLWAAVGEIYPQAQEQLCWNHKMLNVMDAVSKKEQLQAKSHLSAMMYAESRPEALKERKKFEQAFRHNLKAVKTVVDNWERLTTYYDFPREHWKHLRTSNVVESPFSRVRLRTTASRRFKSQVNATCLIWKTLMVAEMSLENSTRRVSWKKSLKEKSTITERKSGRRLITFYPPIDDGSRNLRDGRDDRPWCARTWRAALDPRRTRPHLVCRGYRGASSNAGERRRGGAAHRQALRGWCL